MNIQSKQIDRFIAARVRLNAVNVSGGSYDVTTLLNALLTTASDEGTAVPNTPSPNRETEGVISTAPLNVCLLYDAVTHFPIAAPDGDEVYGRITHLAGVYTITFYEIYNVTGLETPYSFAAPINIDIEIPYRFSFHNLPNDFFISTKSVSTGDDPVASIVNGDNGLTKVGNKLYLGGGLLQNTQINPGIYGISIGASAPDGSAYFDVQGTSKGVLIPRLTKAQQDAVISPALGLHVFSNESSDYGDKVWNGHQWQNIAGTPIIQEHFIGGATGDVVTFTSSTGSGGGVGISTNQDQPNWNGVGVHVRVGLLSLTTNANSNSRASNAIRSGGFNRWRFNNPTAQWALETEVAYSGGQINFVNDPVLDAVGFLSDFTVTNPVTGFYFRRPRTGETNFLKYVIRQASVETIFDTAILYDSANDKFVKVGFFCNGVDMVLKATDDTTFWTTTITNFTATYPTVIGLAFGYYLARNGLPIAGAPRGMHVDVLRLWFSNVQPFKLYK